MNAKKIFICFLILITFVISSCSKKDSEVKVSDASSAEKQVSVLRLASAFDAGRLTPYQHVARGPGFFKVNLIYDSLLEKDVNGDIPWLAKSWNISDDGKTMVFKLQQNVKWHDGKPFTAEDVKFTFDYFKQYPPIRNSLMDNSGYIIKDTTVVDQYTVKLELFKASPTYFSSIGAIRIIPKHIWENVTDPTKFSGEGCNIGCGPYVLTHYEQSQGAYRFEAFKDYWGRQQVADVLEFIPVSNSVLAFENHEIDIASISPDMISRFPESETCKQKIYYTLNMYRLYFNMEKRSEFKDKSIRQAIAYAIDREGLVKKVERGYGQVSSMGYIYPGHSYYNANTKKYLYDVQKAKELMNGRKFSVKLYVHNSPTILKIAELVKNDLSKIGITVEVVSADMKTHDSAVKKGNYEFAIIYRGGMGGDPNMLKAFYTYDGSRKGGSVIGYSNKELDKILDAQSVENNLEKRKELVGKAQAIIAEDVPMVCLYGENDIVVYNPQKNNSWTSVYDHARVYHPKLSFLK